MNTMQYETGGTPQVDHHRPTADNLVWDAGYETWRCELHRYGEQEVRLDRCARPGDRLRVEAVRSTPQRFAVAYTLCPPDSERPKYLTPVCDTFQYWGQAVAAASDIALGFLRRAAHETHHAVLGSWNPWHVIDDIDEINAWRWDGASVMDLQRQAILLEDFPQLLTQYAASIPPDLRDEMRLHEPSPPMRDRFSLALVAVDQRGFALVRTVWYGAGERHATPSYAILSQHTVQGIFHRHRRRLPVLHIVPGMKQLPGESP